MTADDVTSFARESGVGVLLPQAFPDEPERDPRSDFARMVRGAPTHVLRPGDVPALAATLRFLAGRGLPYRLRGGAWSSGGQVVADGGVVVDMTAIAGIVEDRPDDDEITVRAGTTWRDVWGHLRPAGRRPLIVPDNLGATVGGSLALAELGDSSSVHGPTISQVKRLTLVTPDGEMRRVSDGDKLFRFALGGCGLLGAIAEVTLRTVRRPPTFVCRTLAWLRPENFAVEAPLNTELRLYEVFGGVLTWYEGAATVYAVAGNFGVAPPEADPGLWELKPGAVTASEVGDRFEARAADKVAWNLYCPSVQITVPMDIVGEVLRLLVEYIEAQPILRTHLRGVGLLPYATDPRFPVAPQPSSRLALSLMLRPQVKKRSVAEEILPYLRTVGLRALELGGKVGHASIRMDVPDFARRQLGPALEELRGLKAEVDPRNLCNRGVIEGFEA